MDHKQTLQRNAGFAAFFLSGLCAISSGVVVSLLQETYGFAYSMTGTLLSFMSIGNLIAGFASGILPSKMGMKPSVLLLSFGYGIGYLLMGLSGWIPLLMLAFFLAGIARGNVINTCTILVGDNSKNRTRGLNLLHGFFAFGALLCPFIIAAASAWRPNLPMLILAAGGGIIWLIFAAIPMETKSTNQKGKTDWSFFRSKRFWMLTGLLFCQTGTEGTVAGWMVTYFKGSQIISSQLSPYTVTIMWASTLTARMLTAFFIPVKKVYSAMITMSIGCVIFYLGLMAAKTQTAAILLLFAFSFSMAGMNPTIVSCAGRMTSLASIGIMLPVASISAIIMPWLLGIIAEHSTITLGMSSIIVLCVGMLVFSIAVKRLPSEEAGKITK